MNHLEVKDLACVRGERELFAGLGFRLDSGALLYVGGANGAGKTSLLRLLCGLSMPAAGAILWNGDPIEAQAQHYRSEVCYLGHHNALQEALTVDENLHYLSVLAGRPAEASAIRQALTQLGLSAASRRIVRHLSQGQKRRVALARLLLSPASLWVLDEPFVALDAAAVQRLAGLVGDHLQAGGMAIYTSHQKVEIAARSSQVLELGA